jgi:hypothetical protein
MRREGFWENSFEVREWNRFSHDTFLIRVEFEEFQELAL